MFSKYRLHVRIPYVNGGLHGAKNYAYDFETIEDAMAHWSDEKKVNPEVLLELYGIKENITMIAEYYNEL